MVNVSAVIPTRGNVDLSEIKESLPAHWQVVVWDNSVRDDFAVYGRYWAIHECEHEVIYTQDDDCVLTKEALEDLVEAWQIPSEMDGGYVVCNMPQRFRHDFYCDHALVGFGAMFHRNLPSDAFARLLAYTTSRPKSVEPAMRDFYRTCDIAFTALTPRILVDLPYRDLPWASDPDRMWRQPDHVGERTRMLELVRKVANA